jgi:ketosteroid isomerase-like protein
LAVLLAFAGSILLAAATPTPFDEIVAAERAFAAASPEIGFHAAFVTHFAEDGVVFTPVPTNGRKAHEGKPRAAGTLSWGPAWVAAPSSSDLAFSSGPWEYRVPGENAPSPGTGWFFTAWRRQSDGRWMVEADLGIDAPFAYDAASSQVADALAGSKPSREIHPGDAAAARAKIATAERALARSGSSGLGGAVTSVADGSIRVYRSGSLPATGTAAAPLLTADGRKASCVAARIAAAATGDLGYAYGTCTPEGGGDAKPFGYLRVWKRQADGSWRVFVDVTP